MRFLFLLLGLLFATVAHAGAATVDSSVAIKMRNPEGEKLLRMALNDPAFWDDAWTKTYTDEWYDEVRLKPLNSGYLPFITGEGDRDYDHDVVAHIVFNRMPDLEKYMEGAKRVVTLGTGVDPSNGLRYTDTYMYLDLTVFYAVFPQRMYELKVNPDMTVLYFEKLDSSFVDAATWKQYQAKIEDIHNGVVRRWGPFNTVIEVTDVYGMFIVTPGDHKKSRVTFASKLVFGDDTSWIARWGSQLPVVLKAGLKSGYNACVKICNDEQSERDGKSG